MKSNLKIQFCISWAQRIAQVLVSDQEGPIITDEITAPDQPQFFKAIQDEIKYYAPLPVRIHSL